MVTPMTQRFFGFGELANSLMYSLCGVEVILGFFFVRWLSRRVADRAVLAAHLLHRLYLVPGLPHQPSRC